MKVSAIVTVTIMVTNNKLLLNGLPNKFIGCFTKVPTRNQLKDGILYKADTQRMPESALRNIFKVVDSLPGGELDIVNTTIYGMVTVFTTEPLFVP